jgi:8-oxo-dGTP diphosphatase
LSDSASSGTGGQTRVAAYALCADEAGRILLCRVAATERAHAGEWTLPGGGLDFGERPRDGALRELAEESGLVGEVTGVADAQSVVYPPSDWRAEPLHAIRLIFHVRVIGGELRDEPDGSTDRCAWLTPDEARQLTLVDLAALGLDLLAERR